MYSCHQSGITLGVLNVVMADATRIGTSLMESPQVRKITSTGSRAVGKKLMVGAADTVKKVSLELGGNAPCIVFDDADLEVAIKGGVTVDKHVYVQIEYLYKKGIYEKFTKAFSEAVQNLKVGNGLSDGVSQGSLINEAAVQKVDSFVEDVVSKGAKLLSNQIQNGVVEVDRVKEEDSMDQTDDAKEKGVPNFWVTAMKTHEILAEEISESDEEALNYLKDIKWSRVDDPRVSNLTSFLTQIHFSKTLF